MTVPRAANPYSSGSSFGDAALGLGSPSSPSRCSPPPLSALPVDLSTAAIGFAVAGAALLARLLLAVAILPGHFYLPGTVAPIRQHRRVDVCGAARLWRPFNLRSFVDANGGRAERSLQSHTAFADRLDHAAELNLGAGGTGFFIFLNLHLQTGEPVFPFFEFDSRTRAGHDLVHGDRISAAV